MQVFEDSNKTVSEIVRSDYRTAEVFKKYGINYCCSGLVRLEEACSVRQLDYIQILDELRSVTRNIYILNTLRFSEWKLDFLIDYLINVHHAYLKQVVPALEAALVSFIDGHKKKYPELERVLALFKDLTIMLMAHSRHEEEIIFPYIKQIENTYRRKETYGNLFVRTLRKPLSNISREHNEISILLMEMQSITNNYQFPENACTNHQVIYHRLHEFHDDMVQHKHLENNILFPRAIEMESKLLQL
jgi:regulator of cell morphogenesis and NO signaling